jgi:general secretion pathway protein G
VRIRAENLKENSKPMKSVKNNRGMTLVEIMIVLVILGSLATVLITKVTKQLSKARVQQAKILISEVGKALDQFNTDCSFYPTSEQGLQALVTAPAAGGKTCSNWGPESYLSKIPKDPWKHELVYTCTDGQHYVLKSYGADGVEGGDGLNADISSEDL